MRRCLAWRSALSRIRELLAALLTAGCAFSVDVAILYVLTAIAGWHYLLAASIAFLVGSLLAWILSIRFVFDYRRFRSPGREFACFALIGLFGLVLNDFIIAIAVESFGQHVLVGKLCAGGVTFGVNYSLRKTLLFSRVAFAAPWGSAK
jgi:putative flippase GtrA